VLVGSVDPYGHGQRSPRIEREDVQRTTNPALVCSEVPSEVAILIDQTRCLDGGTFYGGEGREDLRNVRWIVANHGKEIFVAKITVWRMNMPRDGERRERTRESFRTQYSRI
jgi:hypothetical protein